MLTDQINISYAALWGTHLLSKDFHDGALHVTVRVQTASRVRVTGCRGEGVVVSRRVVGYTAAHCKGCKKQLPPCYWPTLCTK